MFEALTAYACEVIASGDVQKIDAGYMRMVAREVDEAVFDGRWEVVEPLPWGEDYRHMFAAAFSRVSRNLATCMQRAEDPKDAEQGKKAGALREVRLEHVGAKDWRPIVWPHSDAKYYVHRARQQYTVREDKENDDANNVNRCTHASIALK